MTVHDVLLEFWATGIKLYLFYCVAPVFAFGVCVRLMLNSFPVLFRGKK